METVSILWGAGAAVAVTLAVACGAVWLIERRDGSSLLLCILGVATAASALFELFMMSATTAAEYAEWLRLYYLPVGVALVAMLLFVHSYLGTGREWLLWTVVIARSTQVLVNFLVYPNFAFSSIDSLRSVTLLGEDVAMIDVATPSARQWFAAASSALLVAYLLDAGVNGWLKGTAETRRRAVAVSLGIVLPMSFNFTYVQLMVFGLVPGIWVSNLPWFLGGLLVMASELGRDFIVSRRERLELAELREGLAQVDRLSVMAQLATALAHELTQPLAATAANVEAGRAQLKRKNPDLEELNAILDDIGKDDRRATEIIERMRQFFRRRAIDMQPVSVEDIVHDAVSLIRAEATYQQVVLRLLIQPGLPLVLGDRVHLSQVLLNLLLNSIQALQSQPIEARRIVVEAQSRERDRNVEITVRDSGPGIPDGVMDNVFKPFFTTKANGMGMGLALSRSIVEAHGGCLWVDKMSHESGAVFRFSLRALLAQKAAALPIPNSDHSAPANKGQSTSPTSA